MPRLIKYLSAALAMVLIITLILPISVSAATVGIPTPASGPVGTNVTISGGGTDGDVISIRFPSSAIQDQVYSGTVDSSGVWTSSFDISEAPAGNQTIYIYVGSLELTKTFRIIPSVIANKISAVAGTEVTISGTGFQANDGNISVSFDGSNVLTGIDSDAKGSIPAASFTVPVDARGANIVAVSDTAPTPNTASVYLKVFAISPGQWTDASESPPVVMGTDTNVFTIAADGTTMFMWTKTSTALAKAIGVSDEIVWVSSTEGFPATGTIRINGSADIAYSARDTRTFTLTAASVVPYAVALKVEAGTTINAAALYKSTDAGITWSADNLTVPATPVGASITMLKVCPTDMTQLIASDGTNLYRSFNGGIDWSAAVELPIGGAIKSIDISAGPEGTAILVGTTSGVCQFDPAQDSWSTLTANPGYAVTFSPDYMNDLQVLAVVDTGSFSIALRTRIGTKALDADVQIANIGTIATISTASITFPRGYSYSASNQVFVGINDASGASGDLYRIDGALFGYSPIVKKCGVGADVNSVAVNGTKTDSTVIVALTGTGGITLSTDADTSSAPEWSTGGVKNPIVTLAASNLTLVLASTGVLYAGCTDNNSGFYRATPDFKSFNGISRMEVSNIYNISYSYTNLIDNTVPSKSMYFYQTPAGNLEMRLAAVDALSPGFYVNPNGVRDSNVLYAVFNKTKNKIQKSIDFGLNWTTLDSPGNQTMTTLHVVTNDLYYIGYVIGNAGYIQSNKGSALLVSSMSKRPSFIRMVGETGILVGCNGRPPSTWFYSTDSGANFSSLGTPWTTAKAYNYVEIKKTIYVVDAAGVLWSWILDESDGWKQDALTNIPSEDLPYITSVDVVMVDVVVDVTFISINRAGVDQVYRSLSSPDGSFDFRSYPGTINTSLGGQVNRIDAWDNGNGTFNLKAYLINLSQPYPAGGVAGTTKLYTYDYFGEIGLNSPAPGAEVSNQVDLKWDAPAVSVPFDYEYEVSNDPNFLSQSIVTSGFTSADTEVNLSTNFNSIAANQFSTNGTLNTFNNNALENGETYYWRVRVNDQPKEKLNSLWSDPPFSFSVVNSVADGNVSIAVTLEPADRPAGSWVVPLTVKFFDRSTDDSDANVFSDPPVYTFPEIETTWDGDTAVIQCSGIADGTYDITAVSDHTLMNVKRGVIISGSPEPISLGTLREGNANNDNKINIFDYGVLFYAYGKTPLDKRADFNMDGTVNTADFDLLKANYGQISPILVP